MCNSHTFAATSRPRACMQRTKILTGNSSVSNSMLPSMLPSIRATALLRANSTRLFSQGASRSNLFSELKDVESGKNKQSANTMVDIDELLSKTPQLDREPAAQRYQDYMLGSEVKDPRDVAKSINISGPASGRSVDVKFQNMGFAIGSVYSIIKTNNIRQQWHYQKRFIRPAKYQKEKKRVWWRKHFARGFSDLMSEISDAKRRGY